jgi:hypothetical protein
MDSNLSYLEQLASNGGAQELSEVLTEGNTTGGTNILVTRGDQIKGVQSDFGFDPDFDMTLAGQTGRAFILGSLYSTQPNAHLFISDPGENSDGTQSLVAKAINLHATDGVDSASLQFTPQGIVGDFPTPKPRIIQSLFTSIYQENQDLVNSEYVFEIRTGWDGSLDWLNNAYVLMSTDTTLDSPLGLDFSAVSVSHTIASLGSGAYEIRIPFSEFTSITNDIIRIEIGFFDGTEQHTFIQSAYHLDGSGTADGSLYVAYQGVGTFDWATPNAGSMEVIYQFPMLYSDGALAEPLYTNSYGKSDNHIYFWGAFYQRHYCKGFTDSPPRAVIVPPKKPSSEVNGNNYTSLYMACEILSDQVFSSRVLLISKSVIIYQYD